MITAVLYLRSSKDRSDVSIDAQRRELLALAANRNLPVVREFVDVVESGKDENRPGYRELLAALHARDREWREILILDTSRLARNVYIAAVFRQACEDRGVKLTFAKMPESNPITDLVMRQVMTAFDQVHSMMSRDKALAGMAENVRQGWRAGGRAPIGYRLEEIETGAIRDGEPVTKSRLVPSDEAPAIAAYLKGRAAGKAGSALVRALGLKVARATLVGVEWNALTYAGCTVWNVHNERIVGRGYRNGTKRRPRAEWTIQRATHAPLISELEAERILERLERGRGRYTTRATYLLGGILQTPAGAPWWGNRRYAELYYRTGKSSIKADYLERAVLERLAADLQSEDFVEALTERMRRELAGDEDEKRLRAAQARIAELDRKIARLLALVPETSAARPLLAKVEEFERERAPALAEAAALARAAELGRSARRIQPRDVAAFLGGLAATLEDLPREDLKDFLGGMLERVELDPGTLACRIHYAIRPASGVLVASPREADENPAWRAVSAWRIPALRRRAA